MPHTATRCVMEIALVIHWYGSSNQEVNLGWMNCTRLGFTKLCPMGGCYPAHKMLDHPVSPMEALRRASDIGRAAGSRYVYEGNVPGEKGENTYCYKCNSLLIDRYGVHVRVNHIRTGRCID